MLQKNSIQVSMTKTGDPPENAVAERIIQTIKEEFTEVRQMSFKNIELDKRQISKIVMFYNSSR